MKLQLQLNDVVNAQVAMQALIALKIPVSTAYTVAKNMKELESKAEPYWTVRKSLTDQHADEQGNISDEKILGKINDELSEILVQEIDVNIEKFSLGSLGEIELAPTTLFGIWFMLED